MSLHPAAIPTGQLLDQCQVRRTRASGPGGQHRNKVETAIVITHQPTGIQGQASEQRSQHANQERALQRLRLQLAIHVRTPPPSTPSTAWQERVTRGSSGGKVVISAKHEDFPALIAEALDFLAAANGRPAEAARNLRISTSQFVKLLKSDPLVWQSVNQKRQAEGLSPLR